MSDDDDAPDELPHDVWRALIEQEREQPPTLAIVYSAEASAWALQRWEDAGVNASAGRPWRGDYQQAIGEVAPRLMVYTTLEELVAGFYEGTFSPVAERVASLRDGRQLDVWTIYAGAFWRRWQELQ